MASYDEEQTPSLITAVADPGADMSSLWIDSNPAAYSHIDNLESRYDIRPLRCPGGDEVMASDWCSQPTIRSKVPRQAMATWFPPAMVDLQVIHRGRAPGGTAAAGARNSIPDSLKDERRGYRGYRGREQPKLARMSPAGRRVGFGTRCGLDSAQLPTRPRFTHTSQRGSE